MLEKAGFDGRGIRLLTQTPEAFAASVRGPLLRPGDAAYDETRVVHNDMIDRRPSHIVRFNGTTDVIAAV